MVLDGQLGQGNAKPRVDGAELIPALRALGWAVLVISGSRDHSRKAAAAGAAPESAGFAAPLDTTRRAAARNRGRCGARGTVCPARESASRGNTPPRDRVRRYTHDGEPIPPGLMLAAGALWRWPLCWAWPWARWRTDPCSYPRRGTGGFPRPVLALWRDHERLVQWMLPPSAAAMLGGAPPSRGPTQRAVSWTVPVPAGGPSAVAGVRAWVSGPGVLDLAVDAPARLGITATTVELPLAAGEHVMGLGERFGHLDLRGGVWDNQVQDQRADTIYASTYSPTPFLVSSAGYGLGLDSDYPARFDIGAAQTDRLETSVTDPHPHLSLFVGGSPADILTRRAIAVGLPPLPPVWGLGVWKTLIGGTSRVRSDAARLAAAGVSYDAVWIYDAMDEASGFGWRWRIYDQVPPGPYSDLPGLIAGFHVAGAKVLGYTTPFVYQSSAAYTDALAHGYLLRGADGQPVLEEYHGAVRGQIDFSNPAAATWYTTQLNHALTALGFDGAMQDYDEEAPTDARYANGAPAPEEHNLYPLQYAQAIAAAAAAKPGQTVFFARSGTTGTQHLATGRFTGDQQRSWDPQLGLPSALHAMLSGSVSGSPYWGPTSPGSSKPAPPPPGPAAARRNCGPGGCSWARCPR